MKERWMLEDQIRHNKRVTVWLFVIVFVILWALVMAVGFILDTPPLFTGALALIIGLVYLMISSSFSIPAILRASRAVEADPKIRQQKLLIYKVEEMAIAAGMPMPKVYVTPSQDINAFATGKKPEASIIAVTQGALDQLNAEELEGVLAHEMSHIRNYDIRIQTYVVALVGLIAMLSEIVLRSLFWSGGGRRGGNNGSQIIILVIAIVLIILAPILSRLVYMSISRKREYLADASGAQLTRNPEGLASALTKIGGMEPKDPHRGEKTVASLYLANPFKRVRRASAFATHPPIQERIDRLRRM